MCRVFVDEDRPSVPGSFAPNDLVSHTVSLTYVDTEGTSIGCTRAKGHIQDCVGQATGPVAQCTNRRPRRSQPG
jgi:hypothetical protein